MIVRPSPNGWICNKCNVAWSGDDDCWFCHGQNNQPAVILGDKWVEVKPYDQYWTGP